MSYFPPNILLIFTHESYFVPKYLETRLNPDFLKNDKRLLKNFSDWGTRFLKHYSIPLDQIIDVGFSRAIGDPNRDRNASDIFRDTDFWEVPLWQSPLSGDEKEELLIQYYDQHHARIAHVIQMMQEKHGQVFILDIHDTGNLIMRTDPMDDRQKPQVFPPIALCDNEGTTLPVKLRDSIDSIFQKNFDLPIVWNDPYKRSYTSGRYSNRDTGIFTLQVEFGRYLLIDESQQMKIDRADDISNALCKSLKEIGELLV